jgi:hypothetical protein
MGTEERAERRDVVRARIWVARVAKRRCHVVKRIAMAVSILCLVVVWLELGHTVSCEAVSALDIDRERGTHEME